MPVLPVRVRVEKVVGEELGVGLVGVLEAEGPGAHQLVVNIRQGSTAAKAGLRPGDRILLSNNIPCDNLARLMHGVTHKVRSIDWFDHTHVDFLVQRHYPVLPQTPFSVTLNEEEATGLAAMVEWDGSLAWAGPGTGLEKGDRVVKVGDRSVECGQEAFALLKEVKTPKVEVSLVRGSMPSLAEETLNALGGREADSDYLALTFNTARYPRLQPGLFGKDGEGKVWISRVNPGTLAWAEGLLPLDRIMAVNGVGVSSVAQCGALVAQGMANGGLFWLLVQRLLSTPALVYVNKVLWAGQGAKPAWTLPLPAPDINQLRHSILEAKKKPPPLPSRSISKDKSVVRRRSSSASFTLPSPTATDPPTDSTPSPDSTVSFNDAHHTFEVHMDVVPRAWRTRQ